MARKLPWSDFDPSTVTDIQLPHPFIEGPLNSMGEECPWPWDPQQLVGAPMGQYHCPYCGDMVLAGMMHVDFRGIEHG